MSLTDAQSAWEANLEAAFASALSGVGPTVFTSESDTQDIPSNRIEVVATLRRLGPHQRVVSGSWEYDQGQMQVDVSYVDEPGSGGPKASGAAGKLRNAITTTSIQAGLSGYAIGSVDLVSTTREADDERNEIALRHTYELHMFLT